MVYVFLIGNGSDHSAGHVNVKTSRQETSLFIEGSSAPDYRFFVPPLSVSVMSYHRISGLFRLLLQAVGGEEALLDSADTGGQPPASTPRPSDAGTQKQGQMVMPAE